ncbi:hypothetical protein MMC31_003910 [Peltigera leucophlebia]|nr:hypothetical protein [Peltigera leucophlebia]
MPSTQTLVEHVHGETSTSISPSSAFTMVQSNPETTEASTVFNESTTDSAKITANPWIPKYLLTLGKTANIPHVKAQFTHRHFPDGGGVRAYSTLLIIRELMEVIAQIEQQDMIPANSSATPFSLSFEQEEAANHDSTRMAGLSPITSPITSVSKKTPDTGDISSRFLPCHYFDYIGGTSTGGIIAIMLARLRMNISECIDKYKPLGAAVIGRPQSFTRNLEPLIPHVIWSPAESNSNRLRDYIKEVVDSTLLKTSPGSEKPDTFESNPDLCRTRAPECAIWEVARATSANPPHFKPIKINESSYLDGGIGANNPSGLVLHEVMQMHSESKNPIDLLLSIGTGTRARHSPLKSIISTQTEDTHKRLLKMKTDKSFCYKRFDADGLGDIKQNSWKPKQSGTSTLQRIAAYTKRYLEREKVQEELRECARKLVDSRRRRAETSDWEHFAFGIQYRCVKPNCISGARIYKTRASLMEHLQKEHNAPPLDRENFAEIQALLKSSKI